MLLVAAGDTAGGTDDVTGAAVLTGFWGKCIEIRANYLTNLSPTNDDYSISEQRQETCIYEREW